MARMNSSSPIVLASRSPRRRQLLSGLGIDFEVIPADIEEVRNPGEGPTEFATRAAHEKGAHVMARLESDGRTPWIVSADTIVVLGDEIFTKPTSRDDAREMMGRLSGEQHQVITGWAVGRSGQPWHLDHEVTAVTFHMLSDDQIDGYVATGEGLDKAGAYAIQGIGAFLVERVEGCYFNVVGLPVSRVVRALLAVDALPGFLKS
jgi:septum formation protein